MRVVAPSSVLLLAAACSYVPSSAHITGRPLPPSAAPVEISATRDPPSAEELGIIEAHGRLPTVTLEALATEFRSRVAAMGGDFGRIDDFATRHDMVSETVDYECGTTETELQTQIVTQTLPDGTTTVTTETVPVTRYVSKTCSEVVRVEVATLTLVGRAFRTSRGKP